MQYTQVKDPKWVDEAHTIIECLVNFDALPEEFVPFAAVASGDLDHTHEIFARCVAGEFGPIAEYTPPSDEVVSAWVRSERNRLLVASDWTQLPDVPQTTKDSWAAYRQALRDITEQAGFPRNVTWPTAPQ